MTDVTLAHTDVPAALSPFSYVAPADLVLFLGITVLLLASGVVETRRLGLMARIAAAPVRRRAVVAALIATSLCVAAAQSAGLLLVGRAHLRRALGQPRRRLPGPGHALARLRRRRRPGRACARAPRNRRSRLAVVLGIVCGLLGGCMYPLDVVGPAVRAVGHVVPQAWAMDAFVKLIYNHVGLTAVLPEIGALAVFAVVLGALGAARLRADGVLARVKAPGQPAEFPGVVGPEGRVAAAVVEVPAAAAALHPHRVLEPGLQPLVVAPLHARLDLDGPHAGPRHEGQARWRCS